MREHRAAHAVADRKNTLDAGAALVINLDKTTFVGADARIVREQAVGKRPSADRDDQPVHFQGLFA